MSWYKQNLHYKHSTQSIASKHNLEAHLVSISIAQLMPLAIHTIKSYISQSLLKIESGSKKGSKCDTNDY